MDPKKPKAAQPQQPAHAQRAPSRNEDPGSAADALGSGRGPGSGASDASDVRGEGDPESARHYNDAQQQFVQSGRVQEAARDAAPRDDQEAQQMKRAEDAGRERAKGEDPTVPGANAPQRGTEP